MPFFFFGDSFDRHITPEYSSWYQKLWIAFSCAFKKFKLKYIVTWFIGWQCYSFSKNLPDLLKVQMTEINFINWKFPLGDIILPRRNVKSHANNQLEMERTYYVIKSIQVARKKCSWQNIILVYNLSHSNTWKNFQCFCKIVMCQGDFFFLFL